MTKSTKAKKQNKRRSKAQPETAAPRKSNSIKTQAVIQTLQNTENYPLNIPQLSTPPLQKLASNASNPNATHVLRSLEPESKISVSQSRPLSPSSFKTAREEPPLHSPSPSVAWVDDSPAENEQGEKKGAGEGEPEIMTRELVRFFDTEDEEWLGVEVGSESGRDWESESEEEGVRRMNRFLRAERKKGNMVASPRIVGGRVALADSVEGAGSAIEKDKAPGGGAKEGKEQDEGGNNSDGSWLLEDGYSTDSEWSLIEFEGDEGANVARGEKATSSKKRINQKVKEMVLAVGWRKKSDSREGDIKKQGARRPR